MKYMAIKNSFLKDSTVPQLMRIQIGINKRLSPIKNRLKLSKVKSKPPQWESTPS